MEIELNSPTIWLHGEAEVNPDATIEETYKNLSSIAEQCGYYVTMRKEGYFSYIEVDTSEQRFRLTYDLENGFDWKLYRIERIITLTKWSRG